MAELLKKILLAQTDGKYICSIPIRWVTNLKDTTKNIRVFTELPHTTLLFREILNFGEVPKNCNSNVMVSGSDISVFIILNVPIINKKY